MAKVYFWRDLIGHETKFFPYKAKIQQLLAGDYSSLSLEKLKIPSKTPIYSIRINKEHRLLFTTYQGKLCLLDVVLNHDYHKSPFLRTRGILNAFLDKHHESLTRATTPPWALTENEKDDFVNVKSVSGLNITAEDSEFAALDYYQSRLIEFSTVQNELLSVALPLVVSGPAGSGKSCTALSILSNHVQRYLGDDEAFPILYMSRSRHLVADIRRIWQEKNPFEFRDGVVLFKTYDELLDEQIPEGFRLATPEVFHSWHKEYLAHNKKLSKTAMAFSCVPLESTKDLWREFRIISGGFSKEEYLALGEGQSGVSDKGARELIFKSYCSYMDYLSSHHLIESELYSLKASLYKLVVVDEAQDLSYGQLLGLSQLAGRNSVFLLGEHQILFDGLSRQGYLQRLFHQLGMAINLRQLQATYRCSPAVLAVANSLIRAKYCATGGAADKGEVAELTSSEEASARENQAIWLHPKNKIELSRLKEQASHGQLAVVAWSVEAVNEAHEALGTPLVFTPAEIKGLEYPIVVLWQPLSGKECEDACEKLREIPAYTAAFASASTGHLPKKGQGNTASLPYFNELITAVTRAQHTLIIIQELSNHAARPLINVMAAAIPSMYQALNAKSPGARMPISSSSISSEEGLTGFGATTTGRCSSYNYWEAEAAKLITGGLERQAKDIFLSKLKRTKDEYEAFAVLYRHGLSSAPSTHLIIEAESKFEKISAESVFSPSAPASLIVASPIIKHKTFMSIEVMKDTEEKEKKLKDNEKTLTAAKKSILLKLHIQDNLDCLSDPYVVKWMKDALRVYSLEATEKTLFHWFFSTPSGFVLFNRICTSKYSKILENIHPEAWGQTNVDGRLDNSSALEFLCSTVEGLTVINYLVINLRWVVDRIPAKTWANCTREKISPLSLLMQTDIGIESLLVLLWNYPKFREEIPAKSWFLAPISGPYTNVSPFYWLCGSPNSDSNLLFELIMDKCLTIPSSFWTQERHPEISLISANPLFILAGNPVGREKIRILMEKFPHVIRSIPPSAWAEAQPLTSKIPNTTALYWLTASIDATSILRYFIENFPDIIEKIPSIAWGLAPPATAILDPNVSPLFWLTVDNESIENLRLLILNCPGVIAGIPSDAWGLTPLETSSDHTIAPPISMLSKSISGCSIIKYLLETQPEVITNIPVTAWEYISPENGIPNAIYSLYSKSDGIEIIQLLKAKLSGNHPLKKLLIKSEEIEPGKPTIFAGAGNSFKFFLPELTSETSVLTTASRDGPG